MKKENNNNIIELIRVRAVAGYKYKPKNKLTSKDIIVDENNREVKK